MPAPGKSTRGKKAPLTLLVPSKLGLSSDEIEKLKIALRTKANSTLLRMSGGLEIITGVTNGIKPPTRPRE